MPGLGPAALKPALRAMSEVPAGDPAAGDAVQGSWQSIETLQSCRLESVRVSRSAYCVGASRIEIVAFRGPD